MVNKVEVDPDLVIEASKRVHAGRDIGLEALEKLQDIFAGAIAAVGGNEEASRKFLHGEGGQPGFAAGASSMTAARRSFNDGEDMTGTALNDVAAAVLGQDMDSARGFR